jgi:hypothetical protein
VPSGVSLLHSEILWPLILTQTLAAFRAASSA